VRCRDHGEAETLGTVTIRDNKSGSYYLTSLRVPRLLVLEKENSSEQRAKKFFKLRSYQPLFHTPWVSLSYFSFFLSLFSSFLSFWISFSGLLCVAVPSRVSLCIGVRVLRVWWFPVPTLDIRHCASSQRGRH
jgi:hypothetical protein